MSGYGKHRRLEDDRRGRDGDRDRSRHRDRDRSNPYGGRENRRNDGGGRYRGGGRGGRGANRGGARGPPEPSRTELLDRERFPGVENLTRIKAENELSYNPLGTRYSQLENSELVQESKFFSGVNFDK